MGLHGEPQLLPARFVPWQGDGARGASSEGHGLFLVCFFFMETSGNSAQWVLLGEGDAAGGCGKGTVGDTSCPWVCCCLTGT